MSTQRQREECPGAWERDPRPFGSSFYMFFFPPPGPVYVNWASQRHYLFYLRSSLWSLDLPFVLYLQAFPFLVFCCCQVTSVVSDSVQPHGLQPTRLLHPWDFPGNSTGVGCHCLLPPCLLATAILDSCFLF